MPDDNDKQKTELDNLGQLVDRYAQSRAFGLWASVLCGLMNMLVLVGSVELGKFLLLANSSWWIAPIVFAPLWVLMSAVWLIWFEKKHNYRFYNKRDGRIEVEKEMVSVSVVCASLITFLGATILSAEHIMPVRWALTIALSSFGLFTIYLGKKQKDKVLGIVNGSLCLFAATVTVLGLPLPFTGKDWIYSYFATLYIYLNGTVFVTMVIVHIYNRRILHKIKQMRPFGEQESNKSDS